jgi:hypothetical protein
MTVFRAAGVFNPVTVLPLQFNLEYFQSAGSIFLFCPANLDLVDAFRLFEKII